MTDPKTIAFAGKDYTEASLKEVSVDDLLSLRNEIAKVLGVAETRAFKDAEQAQTQTWKALEKFESASAEKPVSAKKPAKEPKPKADPANRKMSKSSMAGFVKRPSRKQFSTIKKIGEHDGTQGRQHRWANYTDGMTLVDVIEKEGCEPWDVYNWTNQKIMSITEPTDAEYAERRAAFYKRHNMVDPELDKEAKAKAQAEQKAKREQEAAAKKAAAEAAKAAKAAEPAPAA